jgi:hypothetical protein
VTISLTVLQPLKATSGAASAQNCENRFIMGSDKGMQSRSIAVHYQPRFAARLGEVMRRQRLMMRSTPRPAGIIQRAMK